ADAIDFTLVNGTVSFTDGAQSQTILIDVTEDLNIEADENFTLELSNIATANGFVTGFADGNATNTATGTIINDDNAAPGDGVSFDNATVSVIEGNPGDNVQLSFVVNYTGSIPAGETVSVDYNTIVGTADAIDFTLDNGTVSFTDGAQSQTILIDVTEDLNIEADENFTLELSNIATANGFVTGFADGNATNTATGTIIDDDMGEIIVEPYIEEHTIMCSETIPEVPTLIFTGGCGNYTVDFTEVEEFTQGTDDYMIVRTWNVTDICGNTASFQQLIFVMQPERVSITIDICTGDPAIDLLDSLPSDFDRTGNFIVTQGNVSLNGNLFEPMGLELGEYLITYESINTSCKFYADYIINVNADCLPCDINDLVVSKTITVNGDGINDYFEISGLEDCGYTYQVMLFNRWGTKVYESNDYQNDWGGYAPSGSIGSSGILPTGTYYYMITLSDPEIQPINGYIYIGSNK
ncbi:gliding motility-associated C-terminal domain-containing protein, partial [Maribacter sp. 2308TA10-17]|uniref:gliding motility-associated C-terminal domain-containing protein n=1 Tax=Maribacter sp. 2308TA10-17 TaxID=3386276 RepID=UPI0039BC4307